MRVYSPFHYKLEGNIMNVQELAKSYINGEWVEGDTGHTYNDVNPFDDTTLATVSIASKAQLASAFELANNAQKEWAKDAELRKSVIEKAIAFFKENQQEIVDILVAEIWQQRVKK